MPAPWIEAWKAWLARVAERFVQTEGPAADSKAQRVPPLTGFSGRNAAPQSLAPARKNQVHRSGQRHG